VITQLAATQAPDAQCHNPDPDDGRLDGSRRGDPPTDSAGYDLDVLSMQQRRGPGGTRLMAATLPSWQKV
jgi:hypothetical protein